MIIRKMLKSLFNRTKHIRVKDDNIKIVSDTIYTDYVYIEVFDNIIRNINFYGPMKSAVKNAFSKFMMTNEGNYISTNHVIIELVDDEYNNITISVNIIEGILSGIEIDSKELYIDENINIKMSKESNDSLLQIARAVSI